MENCNLRGYLSSMDGSVSTPLQLLELSRLLGPSNPGNPVLHQLYLKLAERTVGRCYENQVQLEDCRQLLWLIFSHPSFSTSDRSPLRHWFERLFPHESESGYSSGGSDRSSPSSLPGPSPTQDKMFVYNPALLFPFPPPPLPPPPPPLCRRSLLYKRSQSEPAGANYVGTRCKVQHRERAIDITPHTTALMSWLKTLRLHKYYPKLSEMSYDGMIGLTEHTLSDITEGARRKILLNVQKLSGRQSVLQDIMGDLSKPGRFNPCITELHNMLMKTPFRLPPSSPLAPHPDPSYVAGPTELISVYTCVLETAGNIILANNIEEECQKLLFKLLEDAAQHAAFPDKERRVVCEILQQCIDNYNYRYGQMIQLKRFDLTHFPQSVKIKFPIKPINGVNHQSSSGYSGYHKFNRNNKPSWQGRGSNGHAPLAHSHSAPVAPPPYSSFANIWSPTSTSSSSFSPQPWTADTAAVKPDNLDYVGLESLCSQIAECALAEK